MEKSEFYNNIDLWISKPKDTWNHITLMAYFCKKYEDVNGVRFRLSRWAGDPGKSKESRDFSKLVKAFLPDDYSSMSKEEACASKGKSLYKVYNYINWMFEYKFRSGEKSVTGTGIFMITSIINEYERMYSSYRGKVSKDGIFSEYIEWCRANVPGLFREHQIDDADDLSMLYAHYKSSDFSNNSSEALAVQKAKDMGLIYE
jgi:hypothetical protein